MSYLTLELVSHYATPRELKRIRSVSKYFDGLCDVYKTHYLSCDRFVFRVENGKILIVGDIPRVKYITGSSVLGKRQLLMRRNITILSSNIELVKTEFDSTDMMNWSDSEIYFYSNKVNWDLKSSEPQHIEFIRKFKEYLNWTMVSRYQILNEDDIREFADFVVWNIVLRYQKLSIGFIKEFICMFDIKTLLRYLNSKSDVEAVVVYDA